MLTDSPMVADLSRRSGAATWRLLLVDCPRPGSSAGRTKPPEFPFNPDGIPEATVTRAKVREISIVLYPADEEAFVSIVNPATPPVAA